jgi:uncharacterized protein (TIGR01777 family)
VSAPGILLTGATGFIGGHVIRRLRERGAQLWAVVRDVDAARAKLGMDVRVVAAPGDIPPDTRIDAMVNLAGAPVIGPPWTRARRKLLIDSRVQTTQALLEWCAARGRRPAVIVSASAIGFYGPGAEAWLDESSPPQSRFQSQLCVAREAAADAARAYGIRVVNLRIGLVLGADGGILAPLARAARFGLAARIGDGRQWMSWIHVDDLLRVIELAIDDASLSGPVNAVSPNPERQRDFQRALALAVRRPFWMWIPGMLLRVALGEMAELLVAGQRVAPRRLLEKRFSFRHALLEDALANLLVCPHPITPGRS